MDKKMRLVLLVLVGLLWASPIMAQGPITPQHSDPTWQASYWNNTALSGAPVLQRNEENLTYDWGNSSPQANVVNNDNFAARWTRYIDVTPGTYRFTLTSDDGVRFWIDDVLLVDKWTEHPAETYTVDQYLGTGHHYLKIEYFEKTGLAILKVQWQLQGQPPSGTQWRGEYFNNITLGGTPVLVRDDAAINFDWGINSPASGVNSDRFSVRWTRSAPMDAGMYTFSLTADDGARLWVNGHLLVDAWKDQVATTYTGQLYLPGGSVTIEMQYYENAGSAVARLSWTNGAAPTPPPSGTVIVDDVDTGFIKGGSTTGWRTANEGHNGRLTWTTNNYNEQANYNWGRWYPTLQARRYEVFVYIPERYTTTANARYWVSHADGFTLKVVDQSATGNRWVSLGTYRFRGNSQDYVSLADITYEPYRSRLIAFDAVKWEPR
ncbi:MAG: hypothetical protein JXA21_03005 [Anaerolineae bacterium]|nr:hypothetical protein [Anaerolineae bacterium]